MTPRQSDTLHTIARYTLDHGFPPTVAEISQEMGVHTTATIELGLFDIAENGNMRCRKHSAITAKLRLDNELYKQPAWVEVNLCPEHVAYCSK